MKTDRKTTGNIGEKAACIYLKKHGYKVIERNFKTVFGEVDIIAENKDYIVFVEVKTRHFEPMLSGAYSVNLEKQRHIIRCASIFLESHSSEKQPRFDIIEIELDDNNRSVRTYNHIENAFIQGGKYAPF